MVDFECNADPFGNPGGRPNKTEQVIEIELLATAHSRISFAKKLAMRRRASPPERAGTRDLVPRRYLMTHGPHYGPTSKSVAARWLSSEASTAHAITAEPIRAITIQETISTFVAEVICAMLMFYLGVKRTESLACALTDF